MRRWLCALAFLSAADSVHAAPQPVIPENLALRATASADSEHSAQYAARFAIDGKIPSAASKSEDVGKAWCVKGDTHRNGATLTLQWPDEVTVAQVVYYGRTAWFAEECWKDYELCADAGKSPVAKGTLKMGDGAQRITLPQPTKLRKLTLKFTSSYGGMNPGAAEVQVYSTAPPDSALRPFIALQRGESTPAIPAIPETPALAAAAREGRLGFDRLVLIQRHPIESSHVYTYHTEGFRAGGGLFVWSTGGQLTRLVDAAGGQILDADVSYDAREILFSWRKSEKEGYHVWRINADGTDLRQLTDGRWHDYNACWLPDGGIAFLSTRSARFAYCWISPVGLLHRMERDGSAVLRLSANIVNDFTPSVLDDGRIIYSRWEYVDRPAIPIQSLWTIRADGTGLAGYYGNRALSPATFMNARSIPGTSKVLCIFTAHNGPARGAIGIVDPIMGDNAQEAIVNLTPEIDIGKVDKGSGNQVKGPYETPFPIDEQHYLAARGGSILIRNYAGTQQATLVPPRDGLWFCNPVPIRPRRKPPVVPSVLPTTAGETGWATVFVQDVYAGLEPHIARGEVAEIAVIQEMEKSARIDLKNRAFDFQFPVISCGATYAGKKVWGFAAVQPDGSASFKVPAGMPIYFMALDAHGRAVQRMRTFSHLMPGEVQGCIGCHEPRNTTTPAKRISATTAEPQDLRPPDWNQKDGFDYCTVVQPILDAHCIKCHSGIEPPNKVDLSGDKTDYFNVSYEWLARGRKGNDWIQWDSPYVNWIPTYNGHEANILEITPKAWGSPRSKLADILLAGHPDKDGQPRVQLSGPERRRIFLWIDLNIPYYGTCDVAWPDAQGCRRILPPDLDKTLSAVAARRCIECHAEGKLPRKVWTRITNPQLNSFLLAPLARSAGGIEACGKPIFASTDDPDYQAILKTFTPALDKLRDNPRDDMPGSRPAPDVCRDRQ